MAGIPILATPLSEMWYTTPSGQGSTNTKIRIYTVERRNVGDAIVRVSNSTDGDKFTVAYDGRYTIHRRDFLTTGAGIFGVSVDSNQLTTAFRSITTAHQRMILVSPAANGSTGDGDTYYLTAGQVIRSHDDTTVMNATDAHSWLRICYWGP